MLLLRFKEGNTFTVDGREFRIDQITEYGCIIEDGAESGRFVAVDGDEWVTLLPLVEVKSEPRVGDKYPTKTDEVRLGVKAPRSIQIARKGYRRAT